MRQPRSEMVALADKMSGTGRVSLAPAGPYTPPLTRWNGMPAQSTTAPTDRNAKRNRLREIVAGLGREATPARIREEAYRVGFGAVNTAMLVHVRNELWPDRPKHRSSGGQRWQATSAVVPVSADGFVWCPACNCHRVRVKFVYHRADGGVTRRRTCRSCSAEFVTRDEGGIRYKAGWVHPRRAEARAATEKVCTKCKRVRPVICFGKKAGDADLYRPWCNDCINHQRKVSHRSDRGLFKRLGITEEQYRGMLARQGDRCLICGNLESGKRAERGFPLSVDHCHTTNKVRGLLCNKCNLGIGNFNDDPARLEAAAAYLRRHEADQPRKEV